MNSVLFKIVISIIFSTVLMACEPKKSDQQDPQANKEQVVIETDLGNISIELLDNIAPQHAASFLKLVKSGFYDETTFHRVIPDFMIQGGDPLSKDQNARQLHGTGGPGYQIPAEFSDLKHVRGIVSAARSQDINSAGSQFFIMVKAAPHLDGQYSIFGRVTSGMDIVDKISEVKRDRNDNPQNPIRMRLKIVETNL